MEDVWAEHRRAAKEISYQQFEDRKLCIPGKSDFTEARRAEGLRIIREQFIYLAGNGPTWIAIW